MRRLGICLLMMLKRMGKHPVYWILLLLFPTTLFIVPKFNRAAEEKQILAGYVVEESEAADPENEASYSNRKVGVLLERELGEESLFRYIKYSDELTMKEDIVTGKLSCGALFDREFSKRLKEQDYHHCITLYLPEGMNVGGMVQEDIFRRVYQVHSAIWYAEMLGDHGYQIKPEEALQKFSEYQKEGKVFAVNYEGIGKSNKEPVGSVTVLSVRSILAFLTLLSASLGALDAGRDRKRKLGEGIGNGGASCFRKLRQRKVFQENAKHSRNACAPAHATSCFRKLRQRKVFQENAKHSRNACAPAHATSCFRKLRQRKVFQENAKHSRNACAPAHAMYMAAAGAPILPASLLLAGSMLFYTAGMTNTSGAGRTQVLPEFGSAVLYGLLLWLLAMLAGRFVSVKLLEGIMPCFLLSVLLCCPIFFDLSGTIPLLGYLSKLFPITWYLRFWG